MDPAVTLYHAAALFSGRETYFNAALTDALERNFGYRVFLPQRDGYEFGALHKALAERLPEADVDAAAQSVVYFLDMGWYLPRADAVIANLDEPLDEGVVVEIAYAKLMDKPVVGLRTDVRSPFGQLEDAFGGLHFFPAYQCDVLVRHSMPCDSPSEAERSLAALARDIDAAVRDLRPRPAAAPPTIPGFEILYEGARLLFEGVDDIHSAAGLAAIAERYRDSVERLNAAAPGVRGAPPG